MRKQLLLLFFSIILNNLFAQQVRFMQEDFSPHLFNPALLATDDYMSIMLDFQSQGYKGLLNYNSLSLYGKYTFHSKSGKRIGAAGAGMLMDQSEGLGVYKTNAFFANLAYNVHINNGLNLSLGTGGVYSHNRLSLGEYTTGSQWTDNIGFLPDVATGENFDSEKNGYFSVNSGFMLYKDDERGKKYFVGGSAFHLNKPDNSFFENHLAPKEISYKAHAGYRLFEGKNVTATPELLYAFEDQNQYGLGISVSYFFDNENPYDMVKSGSLVLDLRNYINESFSMGASVNQPAYSLGFAYNFNLSNQQDYPSSNAFEFTLALRKIRKKKLAKSVQIIDNYNINEIRNFYEEKRSEDTGRSVEQEDLSEDSSNPENFRFELRREFKFGFNESTLDASDEVYLDELFRTLHENPELKLEINGHADSVGTAAANRKISIKRAEIVKDYLIEKGISKSRISAIGKGSTEPLVPNNSEENRAKNRRVEFIIYKD